MTRYKYNDQVYKSTTAEKSWSSFHGHRLSKQHHKQMMMMVMMVMTDDDGDQEEWFHPDQPNTWRRHASSTPSLLSTHLPSGSFDGLCWWSWTWWRSPLSPLCLLSPLDLLCFFLFLSPQAGCHHHLYFITEHICLGRTLMHLVESSPAGRWSFYRLFLVLDFLFWNWPVLNYNQKVLKSDAFGHSSESRLKPDVWR